MRNTSIFIAIALIFTFISCKQKKTSAPDESTSTQAAALLKAADFNADSAYYFVQQQVEFGPRVPNTEAHAKCAAWFVKTLKKYSEHISVQKFTAKAYDGTTLNLQNIIVSFNPKATERVLLCAHWDSRPFADYDPNPLMRHTPIDGANDGASGAGILIEIARQLQLKPSDGGVDILLLDGEDYGAHQEANFQGTDDWALGSQYWSRNPHTHAYGARFGILLDMVGAENAVFTLEGTSQYYAPDIAQKVWNIASAIGYSDYFSTERTSPITDDHLYINQIRQIPTINIIQHDPTTESGFYKNWHTLNDNLAGISKPTLMAVGQTVLTAVHSLK